MNTEFGNFAHWIDNSFMKSGAIGFAIADENRHITQTLGNCTDLMPVGCDLCETVPLFGLDLEIDELKVTGHSFRISKITLPDDHHFTADILIIWEKQLSQFSIMVTRLPKDEQAELALMQNMRELRIAKDELIKAQQKKQHILQKYERIFSSIDDAIIIFSKIRHYNNDNFDWIVTEANHKIEMVLNYRKEMIYGLVIEDVFPNKLIEFLTEIKQDTQYHDHPILTEWKTERPYPKWFKLQAVRLNQDKLVIIFSDITSIREYQKIIENSEAELRFILDSLPLEVLIKDNENNIIRANKKAAHSFGKEVENVENHNIISLAPDIAAEQLVDDLQALSAPNGKIGTINSYVNSHNERQWIETDKIPFIRENINDTQLLVIRRDVTRFIEIQNQLKNSNESLSQFAAIASHDLQAPLFQVINFIDWLLEDPDNLSSDAAAKILDKIQASLSNMQDLTTKLLVFSSHDQSRLELSEICVTHLIDSAISKANIENADFEIEIPPSLQSAKINVDHALITQVLTNIFSNAHKYNDKNRLHVKIQLIKKDNQLNLRISDNGPGITPEKSEEIFDIFKRAAGKNDISGYGIGLSICQRIMRAHDGDITLNTQYKNGAEFILTFKSN